MEKGFFEREGLKVRMITFRGTNLMLAALMSGDLDYMTILPFTAGASARGVPVKIVGSVTKSTTVAIVSRPEIDSIKSLKGKKIGINSFGSSVDYTAFAALSRSGLDPLERRQHPYGRRRQRRPHRRAGERIDRCDGGFQSVRISRPRSRA